jgi:hypothetical protein
MRKRQFLRKYENETGDKFLVWLDRDLMIVTYSWILLRPNEVEFKINKLDKYRDFWWANAPCEKEK